MIEFKTRTSTRSRKVK